MKVVKWVWWRRSREKSRCEDGTTSKHSRAPRSYGELFWRRSGESLFPKTHLRHWFYHSRGAYHRDLKPENLLLDEEGNLKVTNFSLNSFTEHLKQDGLLHTTCGTLGYVAPEVIGKNGYDGAKDLWVVQVWWLWVWDLWVIWVCWEVFFLARCGCRWYGFAGQWVF